MLFSPIYAKLRPFGILASLLIAASPHTTAQAWLLNSEFTADKNIDLSYFNHSRATKYYLLALSPYMPDAQTAQLNFDDIQRGGYLAIDNSRSKPSLTPPTSLNSKNFAQRLANWHLASTELPRFDTYVRFASSKTTRNIAAATSVSTPLAAPKLLTAPDSTASPFLAAAPDALRFSGLETMSNDITPLLITPFLAPTDSQRITISAPSALWLIALGLTPLLWRQHTQH